MTPERFTIAESCVGRLVDCDPEAALILRAVLNEYIDDAARLEAERREHAEEVERYRDALKIAFDLLWEAAYRRDDEGMSVRHLAAWHDEREQRWLDDRRALSIEWNASLASPQEAADDDEQQRQEGR